MSSLSIILLLRQFAFLLFLSALFLSSRACHCTYIEICFLWSERNDSATTLDRTSLTIRPLIQYIDQVNKYRCSVQCYKIELVHRWTVVVDFPVKHAGVVQ
jgi:hypothetical protein